MPAVPRPAGRDQLSVDDDRTAHIGRTTDFRVELAFGHGGNLLALNDASGCQHLNAVTDRAQRPPCGGANDWKSRSPTSLAARAQVSGLGV